MDPKQIDAGGGDSATSGPKARIPVTPRKGEVNASKPAKFQAKLPRKNTETIVERKGVIPPASPKIPFEHPARAAEISDASQSRSTRGETAGHGLRLASHGLRLVRRGLRETKSDLRGFFHHRRKGRARILNYIVLPVATLLVFLVILALFKFR